MKFDKIKAIIAVVILTAAFYALTDLAYQRYFHMAGDSAGYVDLINRIAETMDMKSAVFISPYSLFDLMGKPVEAYCSSDLLNKYSETSFYTIHSYLIAYIFAFIKIILDIDSIKLASIIYGLSNLITLILIFKICQRNKLSIIESIIFILITIFFTPYLGSISGQFYYDRLFITFGLLVYYFSSFEDYKYKLVCILFLIIITSMISERSSLMIGIFGIFIYLNSR